MRIGFDPHWVPRLPRPGPWKLGVGASIQIAPGDGSGDRSHDTRTTGKSRKLRIDSRGPQPGRRERKSLTRRAPVVTPDLASSPASSAADAMSSVPPGGWTGPRNESGSASNPCLGTGSSAAGRRMDAGLRRLFAGRAAVSAAASRRPFARAALTGPAASAASAARVVAGPLPGLAAREAARLALARWGRVRGRPARTPDPSAEARAGGSPLGESLMRVSIGAGEVEDTHRRSV